MLAELAVALPKEAHIAGLRSGLVSRLTGLSLPQLRYWHESGLLEARLRPGRRGVPRLYSWVDYLRLQIAGELTRLSEPIATSRIRSAVAFLDEHFPEWYLLPTAVRGGTRGNVLYGEGPGRHLVADGHGQYLLLDWPSELSALSGPTESALAVIRQRGSLCLLSGFDDAVFMDPIVNLAQPSVRGTALETRFVAGMARDIGQEEFAILYGMPTRRVRRAMEFEEAVRSRASS